MDFDFAYLRIIGKLLIQFNTIGFHNFYDIGLLQAMGKSIVKVRINQCDQLVVLQKDQRLGNIRHIIQFAFYLFRIDILSAGSQKQILATTANCHISFVVDCS